MKNHADEKQKARIRAICKEIGTKINNINKNKKGDKP